MVGRLGCLLAIGLLFASVNSQNALSEDNNDFAFDIYKQIVDANSGDNVFLSPISIATVFALLSTGARGQTKEQIRKVLHLDKNQTCNTTKEEYQELLAAFNSDTNKYTLHMVDGLFASDSFTLKKRFLRDGETYFNASVQKLNFVGQPDQSRIEINQWVANQTNQTITDLLPTGSVTSSTILVIVNAIYFNALWTYPFQQAATAPGPFWVSKSQQQNADMMHLSNKFLNYYNASELDCQVLELPYKGNTASMFVFLPNGREGLPKLEKHLTGGVLADTLSMLQSHNMVVQLPKFTIDDSFSVKQFMQQLGVVDAFDVATANLSGIGSGHLFVSDAIHKAFVDVSETGTVAAAVTAGIIGTLAVPARHISFIVDHPFLFLLFEKTTQSVLFMGRFVSPTGSS